MKSDGESSSNESDGKNTDDRKEKETVGEIKANEHANERKQRLKMSTLKWKTHHQTVQKKNKLTR